MSEPLKVLKVINNDRKYKDSKGKEHSSVNYYVVANSYGKETLIAVRPCFHKGYSQLDFISEVVVNGKKND